MEDAYSEDRKQLAVDVRRRDTVVMEAMADHLRWWVENWFRKVGELPTFPEKDPVELIDLMGFPEGELWNQ